MVSGILTLVSPEKDYPKYISKKFKNKDGYKIES
jgi:hypothetical protein